jgi:DNA-binding LytR/AlgR family response regulator
MNCIIIDDDQLSRKVLEEFTLKTDFLKLVHSFSNAIEAINTFKSDKEIHLIFLDIEMPEMSGIDFLNTLKNSPQVIIVSSREKYALEAFEYDVTDYLLKPVSYARFYKAVEKVRNRMIKTEIVDKHTSNKEFFVKQNNKLIRLLYDEILFMEALENYVVINTFDEKYTIHITMKLLCDKLTGSKFARIHRSYIVNTDKIHVIEENSVVIKTLNSNKVIPIGKTYKDELMMKIRKLTS